jgi:hypothetical protein
VAGRVGGVGSITWYRLVGADTTRNLPSLGALTQALADVGIDLGDLHEVEPDAQSSPRSSPPPTA